MADTFLPAVFAAQRRGNDQHTLMRVDGICRAAVELGLPTLLGSGAGFDLVGLSARCRATPSPLSRLLVALELLDVVATTEGVTSAGPLLRFLPLSVPPPEPDPSADPLALAWNHIAAAVREDRPAFDVLHGTDLFTYLGQDSVQRAAFQKSMAARAADRDPAVAATFPFPTDGKVVDIGGGSGTLVRAVRQRYSGLQGAIYDLPEVLHEVPVGEVELIPGSIFDSVPSGFDVLMMASVLHDWDDARCLRILRHCRESMTDTSVLLIIDMVLPLEADPFIGVVTDIAMLVLTGGKERTRSEFEVLCASAGLRLSEVLQTETPWSVLVVRTVGTGRDEP